MIGCCAPSALRKSVCPAVRARQATINPTSLIDFSRPGR
jgi:hypothetical protein